ncbi:hypothetical protein N7495_003610 [Penicillium taxi]|uniref:uncharacterized protein n=1 Tax=Penicillium taxi TaxID=168475 RepID=UPI002544F8A5|nr:uncharacterized protein N7495_003610 [Penicillium taxi]KAJ5898866.1 hypothetical protein N7495_003610 [Penicillium taxi]
MMSSNVLSRFLPPTDSPSVYEAIQEHELSDSSDIEQRAGRDPASSNHDNFSDGELEDALVNARDSQLSSPTAALLGPGPEPRSAPHFPRGSPTVSRRHKPSKPRWMTLESQHGYEFDDRDEDVPLSLLVEGHEEEDLKARLPPPPQMMPSYPRSPSPQSPSHHDLPRWESIRTRGSPPWSRWLGGQHPNLVISDPKEKALMRWAALTDLDLFLQDVYDYYLGKGLWAIQLDRALNLLTIAFTLGIAFFLTQCIDYHKVRGSRSLDEILIPQCTSKTSGTISFIVWISTFALIYKTFQFAVDTYRLKHLHDFFYYLLGVSDPEVQTISWQEVVSRLMTLRDSNAMTALNAPENHRQFTGTQSKQRMDAHDIANRLMRRENYMIALVNKDILNLTLPIPFLRNRQLFSRTLEWNLNQCIMDYVFNEKGHVRKLFLTDTHRRVLSDGLRRRFIFAGFMNIFMAPFLVFYFLIMYFLQYFNEFKSNPGEIGTRRYTPLAEWKFREFNEVFHMFTRRLNMSLPFASRYIDQFPKYKTIQLARFVAFVSGSLASVLALASVIDPEMFLGFEITHDRTVLFYLGIFGTVWAVAHGVVGQDNEVYDPEFAIRELIDFTHYFPATWKGRLHSDDVRQEFAALYQMKLVIFVEEILSMIFTPFVLWFSLPKCSDRLIDFFREFTVHVDGVGHVCSFAVFDFKKGSNVMPQGQRNDGKLDIRENYFSTKDGKMLASYYGFLDQYGPNHQPVGRRPFHPPPGLPTLGSPATDLGGFTDRYDAKRPGQTVGFGHSILGGASKFRPMLAGDHRSPAASMLLDPHHQPSSPDLRFTQTHMKRANVLRDVARSQYQMKHPIYDAEEPLSQEIPKSNLAGASSGNFDTVSNPDNSWRMNPDGIEEDAEEDEDIDQITGGAGVLGLLQQFQKTNTDGRRPTVGI